MAAPVLENRKARRNYEVIETLEAGIVLVGTEVKSLRNGRADLGDAYVQPKDAALFIINLKIEPYKSAGAFNHEETRPRKLLLHAKEITTLSAKIKEKRLAVIPLKMYFNERGRVKILLGVARGKKAADKRESEKKEEAKKEMARALRERDKYGD
ncbi:MAG: SsrA-binding protein SmpB [Spirochaetia bacterium]|nr:SsrA-binding protein SmpB [Spirochaetia bacterium]